MRKRFPLLSAALTGLALTGCGATANANATATRAHNTPVAHAFPPLRVLSASPQATAPGNSQITVTFSAPLPDTVPTAELPRLSPSLAGHWAQDSRTELEFVPASAYPEGTHVTVTVPTSLTDGAGGHLTRPYRFSWTAGAYDQARVAQLLAQLGYLPVSFIPAPGQAVPALGDRRAQLQAAFSPPHGRFVFGKGWPGYLRQLWSTDRAVVIGGAVRAFESQHGLTMDGQAGPQVWAALLTDAAKDQRNTAGYSYALASEHDPETLTIWHDGKQVLRTLANTGAPGASTQPGTYPVYEKLQSQVMRGTNLDGSTYADQVYWVSYFHGGDAVHYFDRASYGYPQSLGCVEVPWGPAKTAYRYLTYGSLVTVTQP